MNHQLLLKVTLGEPMCHDAGLKETEIVFAASDLAPDGGITLERLADRLGIRLSTYDGTLMITVNGKVLHASSSNEWMVRDGDHVGLYMMLTNLCNELGLDTSSAGSIIPWAMELYQRGIIGEGTIGYPLHWGDVRRVRDLLIDISKRRGFGDVLADSSQALALGKLPPEASRYLMAVKNLPQSDPHDPRYIKSFALGVAISSRGADHLRSRPTLDILNLPEAVREEIYGVVTANDPTAYETKEVVVEFSETIYAVCECLGLCRFVCRGWNSPKLFGYEHFCEMIKYAVGLERRPAELREIGRRVIDLERMINQREGLTGVDDTLPSRYFDEPMPLGNTKGHKIDREQFDDLLTRYYRLRGWSDEGVLRSERIEEIEAIPSASERKANDHWAKKKLKFENRNGKNGDC